MTVISEYLNVPYRSVFMNTSMVSSNRRISSEYSRFSKLVDSNEKSSLIEEIFNLWTDLTDGGYLSVVGMIVEMRKKKT